ncbi:hypothetical protein [Nostoc sp. UHCC 0870]
MVDDNGVIYIINIVLIPN